MKYSTMKEARENPCKCGNQVVGVIGTTGAWEGHCEQCDSDPDIDMTNKCYVNGCTEPPIGSAYIGDGIEVGYCSKHRKSRIAPFDVFGQ